MELFIIDGQNDFCEPSGALYVQGAEKDSLRLSQFIEKNIENIEHIYISLDSHHLYDVAHPLYWVNKQGEHPSPFTIISLSDLKKGTWIPSKEDELISTLKYLESLERRGKYRLCIWPPHCLIGSWGTQIQKDIYRAVSLWEERHLAIATKIYKGEDYRTEHYGALEAEIPQEDNSRTKLNKDLLDRMKKAERLVIGGQALDYCVANTLWQLTDNMDREQCEKVVLLRDCTSPVDPSSGFSEQFLRDMKKRGLTITETGSFN